jgi:platelet-activating factor acetylhydrolase IB subunit alpha
VTNQQNGHDNWIRALVFHPSGKYLLSASDDKTIKVWDLQNGRCTKTVDAHDKFVTCMTWGRQAMSGAGGEGKVVNVLATGSVDQSVKVSPVPLGNCSRGE